MKIILLKDIAKVGKKDSIIDVPYNLAIHKYISKNLAIVANKENLLKLNHKNRLVETQKQKEKESANEIKNLLEKATYVFYLEIHAKKAQGSITNILIKEKIKNITNIDIDKKKIESVHLTEIGTFNVKINLLSGDDANIKIEIKEKIG